MGRSRSVLLSILILLSVVGAVSQAEIPQVISYQGKVTDASGNPVADASYTMRFRIYDAVTVGTLLWDSGDRSIAVAGGVFSVLLGESPQPAIALAFDVDYWLLVTIGTDDQSPRVRLASAGYAYMASGLVAGTEVSGSVTTGASAAIKGTNTATTGTTYGGRFESSSAAGRGVSGVATATAGTTYGVYGSNSSTAGSGTYGSASATTGTTYGVYGSTASTSGRGVFGGATTTTGATYGVFGSSASTSGRGVFGEATATTGTTFGGRFENVSTSGRGVFGWASATTGATYGGRFESSSTSGFGVFGWATATTGTTFGTWGQISSDAGSAVYGWATATSGSTYAVQGVCASTSGHGVSGVANASTGFTYGVYGASLSTGGMGVYGGATATTGETYGVYGASGSASGTGVFGTVTAIAGNAYGVHGESASTAGHGVFGTAAAVTGTTYGGRFQSASTSGRGVSGEATATTGTTYGGRFESAATSGRGVYGEASATTGTTYGGRFASTSTAGYGVYGYTTANTGTTYAVYGDCASASGFGGCFEGRLRTTASINLTAEPDNHVALLYNSSTGTSPDVLALKVGYTGSPGAGINYLTFFDGNDAGIGAVEGNGAGGVTFLSGGSDFAEYLPRLDGEAMEPGDVVGVFDGKVSKRTEGASQVMVVSTRPIVLGNSPGEDRTDEYARVAFIGQVEVKVRGPVKTGDLLLPSGMEDGVAVAVSRENITAEQFRRVFGQAWEGSSDGGVKQIHAAVGLLQHDPSVARLESENRELREELRALHERVVALEESR